MKEWLSGIVGESTANIVGFVLIFAIILGGIFVVLSLIRRFGGGGFTSAGRTGRQPRLSVMDAAAVDSRRRLVLIRRDDVEHLLLIGGPTDVVVEQNIMMESRANTRAQTSRIEPEHIERFHQHEAAIATDKSERPALSRQAPAALEEAIQLNSPIETPAYRAPEPVTEAPAPQVRPEPSQFRAPPKPPVAPAVPRVQQSAVPSAPSAPTNQPRPQQPLRPAPQYPPQPRTVHPPRPAEQQSPRAHPAYPLSQVSRGVLSSTSGQTATPAAAAATIATVVESVTPEQVAITSEHSKTLDVRPEPKFSGSENAVSHERKDDPVLSMSSEPEVSDDGLEGLSGVLHDAIMADLQADVSESQPKDSATPEMELFENELLSSLDISPSEDASVARAENDSIENAMEKLLGELTRDEDRRS